MQGLLLALDKSERRLKALQRMAVQQGLTDIIHCQAGDLRHFASRHLGSQAAPAAPGTGNETEAGQFDRVLLDAPCSGLGVLAKRWGHMQTVRQKPANAQLMLTFEADVCRADLRWRRHAGEILELSQLQVRGLNVTVAALCWQAMHGAARLTSCNRLPLPQQPKMTGYPHCPRCQGLLVPTPSGPHSCCACLQDELLDAAAKVVRPGGLLVYSTCSIEVEENEGRAMAFLSRHSQFSIEAPPPDTVPPALLNASQALESLPHVHGIDGAYAVRLRHTQ